MRKLRAEIIISSRAHWALICSWNGWHEGTEIEPSVEHGERYIRITRFHADF